MDPSHNFRVLEHRRRSGEGGTSKGSEAECARQENCSDEQVSEASCG